MPDLSIIKIFLFVIFSLAIARQIFYWVWLWQLKEYRIDRMRAHFQDIGFKSTFLAFVGYSSLRQAVKPKLTVKTILIIVFSFFIGVFFAETGSPQNYEGDPVSAKILIYLIFGFLIMPVIIFLFVSILNSISAIFKKKTIAKAAAKIAKFPNLKVIGITGSYGKSTTKEILAEILSKKYRVLKTPANINTAIGIAQLILDKLDETYEIFVVEMGAYKIGEIKEICDIVQPKIGIITAINEQHLALFGSIRNTIEAKFELVDSLPKGGLAILNGDDKQITNFSAQGGSAAGGKYQILNTKTFGFGENNDLRGYDIIAEDNQTSFRVKYKGDDLGELILRIPGKFNVCNALSAIVAARGIGVSFEEIFSIIQKNDWPDFSFKISVEPNNSILIDDTYNSNPDGVIAALNHIKNQQGKKIVIMSSLIELGSEAHKIHQRIGREISQVAEKVFFLDNYYIADIKKGAAGNKNSVTKIITGKNIMVITEQLKKDLKSGDIVLFINRSSRKVLEELKK